MASKPTLRVTSVGPWTLSPAATGRGRRAAGGDAFVDALTRTERLTAVRTYEARLVARRGVAEDQPLLLDVEAPDHGDYVVVARHASGALTFVFGEAVPARARRGARGRAARSARTLRFRVATRTPADSTGRRGVAGKILKIVLFKVAGALLNVAVEKLAAVWEKHAWKSKKLERGLLRVTRADDGRLVGVAGDHRKQLAQGRCLLFFHGTFSNFESAFAPLAVTTGADGRTFFDAVRQIYGERIYALNHFSVSETPLENARELLAALPTAPVTFDVITHSRGALVLRSLVEQRNELGAMADRFRLGNAVLVAGPNAGTPLASPERWGSLTNWVGNLIDFLPDNPFTFGLDFVVEAVGWIARKVGGVIPGLASMNPDGRFIRELQGPPAPSGVLTALAANYEPDRSILARMADVGVDGFFGVANDLVVPTEGSWHVDQDDALVIPGTRIGCFGPGGNLRPTGSGDVHHCNFFKQSEAVDVLVRGVQGQAQSLAVLDPTRPLPAARGERRGLITETARPSGTPTSVSVGPTIRTAITPTPPVASGSPALASAPGGYPLDEVFHLFIVAPEEVLEAPGKRGKVAARGHEDFARRVQRSTAADHAIMIATFRNARVVEPFERKGTRWQQIIAMQENIKAYIAGDPKHPTLPRPEELTKYGELLFDTLFSGEVRRLYDAARAELVGRRLDLCLTSMIGWVADKPWEFAFDPTRRMFLCMEEVNFLRNVVTAVPADAPAPRRAALRLLVVAAQPVGATPLSIDEEREVILRGFRALTEAGLAEVEVLAGATPALLHERLTMAEVEGTPFDILHFVGHGHFEPATGMGYLIFEDAQGRVQEVGADVIRQIVGRRGIRLIFLNACETGTGIRGELDFARGVAPMLVAGGVPAVVANQYSVLDPSATAFAQHFYWALASGRRIGDAAREARVAVNYSITGEAIDWAVPVLFARDPAERFVAAAPPSTAEKPARRLLAASTRRRRDASRGVRVGIWDVNHIIPRLEEVTRRMNAAQDWFDIAPAEISAPIGTWRQDRKRDRGAFLNADEVERKLCDAPARLGVDHLCILTSFGLADDKEDKLSAHVNYELGISIVSASQYLDQIDPPRITVERILGNQLAFTLSGLQAHRRGVKACPGYFNDELDVRWVGGETAFCAACRRRLERPLLGPLSAILKAFATTR